MAIALAAMWPAQAHAQIEIEFWHAMGGVFGDKINQIADQFNARQSDVSLKPEYKGSYTETLTAASKAFATGDQPHIVQVFDVGTAAMLTVDDSIYPLHQLMADHDATIDGSDYLAGVASYFSDDDGNLLALPFNTSTPVLFYNREAIAAVGLDLETLPNTWPDLAETLGVVQSEKTPCGFTTSWQSWIQLENFSAIHGLPFSSPADAILEIDRPAFIDHIAAFASWAKTDLFRYGGQKGESRSLFLSGQCAAYFGSSVAYATLAANAPFEIGVAELPHWPEVIAEPENASIGGAALWVLNGKDEADYAGVARVLAHITSASVQADWHQYTGYLPITKQAYDQSKQQGFYDANPGMEVALIQVDREGGQSDVSGLQLEKFVEIRAILNEELERIWSGEVTAETGLQSAAARGNQLLETIIEQPEPESE